MLHTYWVKYMLVFCRAPIASTGRTLLGCRRWIQSLTGVVTDHSPGIDQEAWVKFSKLVPGWRVAGTVLLRAAGKQIIESEPKIVP